MRKVTELTVRALIDGFNRTVSNTAVSYNNELNRYEMRLHGNLIAYRTGGTRRVFISDCGWTTPTTKERLNGIIDSINSWYGRIYQKDFAWYISHDDGDKDFPYDEFIQIA